LPLTIPREVAPNSATLKLKWAAQVLVVLALLVGLWFFARRIQPAKLWEALVHAKRWPLIPAIALSFGSVLSKSVYWSVAIAPKARLRVWPSFRLTLASMVASLVAPRGGDALKIWQVKKQLGVDVSFSLAVSGLEKLGDTLSLIFLVTALPWVLPELPVSARRALVLLPVGLVLFVSGLLVVAHHPRWSQLRWLSGLSLLRAPKLLARGFVWVFAAWLCDFTEISLVLYAVGAGVGIGGVMLMLLFMNLAIAVPVSPGNAGAQELGAVLALTIAGATPEVALAGALLFHATQIIPPALAGLNDARALMAGRLKLGEETGESQAAVER
jgi:uncharacterized membrane protein YbhN (UPF0104 family)